MSNGAWVVTAVLVAATALGILRMRSEGRVVLHRPGHHVDLQQIGHDIGERATLVQFSSPFCQPCKATHDLLARTALAFPGAVHIDLQVADHLDLVNRLRVMRTPTTVLLDRKGMVRYRAEGVPRNEELLAALERTLAP